MVECKSYTSMSLFLLSVTTISRRAEVQEIRDVHPETDDDYVISSVINMVKPLFSLFAFLKNVGNNTYKSSVKMTLLAKSL